MASSIGVTGDPIPVVGSPTASKIAILYRNLADAATVTASSEVSTLPAVFLQQAHLSSVWRTAPAVTNASILCDLTVAATLRCVAVLGLNLSSAATARVRLSNVALGDGEIYDSGEAVSADVNPDYKSFVHWIPQDYVARYCQVDLSDGSVSHIEAGRLVLGPAWLPRYNYERTTIEKFIVDESLRDQALNGDFWVEERPIRRGLRFVLPGVNNDELSTHLDAMGRHAGRHKDILVSLSPSAQGGGSEVYWGMLESAPSASRRGLNIWRQPFEIVSR